MRRKKSTSTKKNEESKTLVVKCKRTFRFFESSAIFEVTPTFWMPSRSIGTFALQFTKANSLSLPQNSQPFTTIPSGLGHRGLRAWGLKFVIETIKNERVTGTKNI